MKPIGGTFRLWDFRVSHDQLLLRSPKTETMPKNIDIVFVGVEYLELPTRITNPTPASPVDADFHKAELALGRRVPKDRLFVIQIGDRRHIVVAAAMKVFENDLDIFESSLEQFR